MRTRPRRLSDDLDRYPFPIRYRRHGTHFGVPFVPILGSRGCWGSCKYCSITSVLRDARAYGGAKMLRHRSPENIAREMYALSQNAGGRAIFCFHDDNFLMPRERDSLERVRAIREAYDALGGGEIALIGKCRPDSVTPELMREIRALGVIRLYVGVENASQRGADHLGRRAQQACVADALEACRQAGIFVCYNLLLFEPDATLDDVRENVAFMRKNAQHPVNFCRAEPYVGTPLHADVAGRQALGGSYLGFNYRIEDDDTELLFRICSAAFRQRNFDAEGVANRNMGLGYSLKILEQFYEDRDGARVEIQRRTERATRTISLETAGFLADAIGIVERHRGDPDAILPADRPPRPRDRRRRSRAARRARRSLRRHEPLREERRRASLVEVLDPALGARRAERRVVGHAGGERGGVRGVLRLRSERDRASAAARSAAARPAAARSGSAGSGSLSIPFRPIGSARRRRLPIRRRPIGSARTQSRRSIRRRRISPTSAAGETSRRHRRLRRIRSRAIGRGSSIRCPRRRAPRAHR
ncbi:MAG: radical SAM protein [Sandaracinaceae bacterium]|nr:radical SAM protein [Sandaracinaceae bacterium]